MEFSRAEDAPFFAPEATARALMPVALPQADEAVVLKHQVNAFLGTDLKAQLDAAAIEQVTLVGAMSHMCIAAGGPRQCRFRLRHHGPFTMPAPPTIRRSTASPSPLLRCTPPTWPPWPSPMLRPATRSSIWQAESVGASAVAASRANG